LNKAELIDAIASGSKLTKADAGRVLDSAIESSIKLRTFKAMEPEP
jgi:nucleoid DNA-binding protein